MKKIKTLFYLPLIAAVMCGCANSTTSSEESKNTGINYIYREDEMYEKLWSTKVVHNESCVLIEHEDGSIYTNLFYAPTKIISVKNYQLLEDYAESDYRIEGKKIIRTSNSKLPYLSLDNINCKTLPAGVSTYDGKEGKILFTEGAGLIMYHVMVTYEHNDTWDGKIPDKKGNDLPRLYNKLKNKESVNFVAYGDSIFTGCNSSGKLGIEPFQDDFPTGFANEMKRVYGADVQLTHNTAVGGTTSDWGLENIENSVVRYKPDLLMFGFGMNDGSPYMNVGVSDFVANIENIFRAVQAGSPNTDIIFCATILANPASTQNNGQEKYLEPILQMANEYSNVTILDMTTFSQTLYQHKNSYELLANNINHPCDFTVRQYVANLMNLIEVK